MIFYYICFVFVKKNIILLYCLFCICNAYTQEIFYQDICHCGVTGAGFSTGMGFGSGTFQIHIKPGSTIKKAFLFIQRFGNAKSTDIILNGVTYNFNYSNQVSSSFILPNTDSLSAVHVIDITKDIQPSQLNYSISIPYQNNNSIGVAYGAVYLYVIYEQPSLAQTSLSILLNNHNMTHFIEKYTSFNLNPINNSFPVGFALYTDRINTPIITNDGSYVYIENSNIGLVGGSAGVDSIWNSGSRGHFYYQNKQLFGLDDDSPNSVMGGSDGLADISSYINNNSTVLNWKLIWETPNTYYNIYSGFFLTYSSPCSTFSVSVPKDTTICYGEQLQLHASGGTKYKWTTTSDTASTSNDLSCTTCPNPIFSGDTSRVFTVRIWNGDSCSVVRPVRIKVVHPKKPQLFARGTDCGFKNGYIKIKDAPSKLLNWVAVSAHNDTLNPPIGNTFPYLSADDYTLYYVDTFGCKSPDTTVTVVSNITTLATFKAQPETGASPLQVELENQSQNATDYSWSLNGVYQGNNFSGFLADTSGTYHIQLIAWRKDSICADTALLNVIVYDQLVTRIPNVFTPNGDGVNDYFNITVNISAKANLVLLNRWGNVVHTWEGKLQKGKNVLWDGTSSLGISAHNGKVNDGTYFYTIDIKYKGKVKKLKGYLELVR